MGVAERYYTPGQRVTWSDTTRTDPAFTHLIAFGDGPFRIVKVETVPTKCDCDFDPAGGHEADCGVYTVSCVGHEQWVIIETPEGKRHMSGALVALVPEPLKDIADARDRLAEAWQEPRTTAD